MSAGDTVVSENGQSEGVEVGFKGLGIMWCWRSFSPGGSEPELKRTHWDLFFFDDCLDICYGSIDLR